MTDYSLLRRSPISIAVVVIAALILLTILGGLIALFRSMMAVIGMPPVKAPAAAPLTQLLVAILVMLVIIAVLLALLLWCRCRAKGRELPAHLVPLLGALPLLTHVPQAIRNTSIALEQSSIALGWINDRMKNAGDLLATLNTAFQGPLGVGDPAALDRNVPIPSFDMSGRMSLPDGTPLGVPVPANVNFDNKINLQGVRDGLNSAGAQLQNQVITIDGVQTDLNAVKTSLHDAATLLGDIATALDA